MGPGRAGRKTFWVLLLWGLLRPTSAQGQTSSNRSRSWELEVILPEHPAPAESYLCTAVDLPKTSSLKLVGVEPLSKQEFVHHMLLYGCERDAAVDPVWACQGHNVCPGGGNQQILYGWAKGAAAVRLPKGVGYRVGSGTKINNLVLQIHFAVDRPEKDVSGVKLHLSDEHVPFSAGMLMYASYFEIPPKKEEHLVPTRCCYPGFEPAHGFAFRVHTHMLGRSVYLDEIQREERRLPVVSHDPQLPQGFTPVSRVTFWPGQTLEATCNFSSLDRTSTTYAGATHHNEMCNLYMILWSELPVFMSCYGGGHATIDRNGAGGIPRPAKLLQEDPQEWQPPQSLEDYQKLPGSAFLGQVSGVAKGHNGTVWVFHRGDRIWDSGSFTGSRAEHVTHESAIAQATVLQLDQDTGQVLASWGKGLFSMPHMVTVDRWGNIWLTDVGLHQVFKYDSAGKLQMTLGQKKQPGTGSSFCKPTHVAIGNDGSVFVSDGYCNPRVAQFSANGTHLGDFELYSGSMNIPHSVVLEECSSALVVADREAAKVQRFELGSRKPTGSWDLSKEGLVYGLATGPYGSVFALCWDRDKSGSTKLALLHSDPGQGVEESWKLEGVESPHDVAIIAAPGRLAGTERPLAVLVGETRRTASRLHKFIILPSGASALPSASQLLSLGLASEQWKAAFAASESLDSSTEPSNASAVHVSLQHSHGAGTKHSAATKSQQSRGAVRQLSLRSDQHRSSAHFLLISIPILFCCAGVGMAYRLALSRNQPL